MWVWSYAPWEGILLGLTLEGIFSGLKDKFDHSILPPNNSRHAEGTGSLELMTYKPL